MQRYFGIAQTLEGQAVPSATVRVRLAGTATDATLYSDNSYTPQVNPFTSEADGAYQFYARDGRYDIIVSKTGYTFDDDDTRDVLLEDAASVITPAQITADQNNYTPTNGLNASVWRLSSDTVREITGIVAGNSQQLLTLINVGSFNIILSHQSALSSAANRITVGGLRSYVLFAGESVTLRYDLGSTTWRVQLVQLVRTLDRSGPDGPFVVDSGGETLIWRSTMQGGLLSTGGRARYEASFNLTGVIANEAPVFRLYYGGNSLSSANTEAVFSIGGDNFGYVQGLVAANGSTSQRGQIVFLNGVTPIGAPGGGGVGSLGTGSVGSSGAQEIMATVTLRATSTSTGTEITLHFATLEWLP